MQNDWLNNALGMADDVYALLLIALICAVGISLGKMKVKGVGLGVTFVFFTGILAGHCGLHIDPVILLYAMNMGLVLFIYTLGLQVGPGFVSAFRSGGVQLNLLGLALAAVATLMAVACHWLTDVSLPDMMGILCGATTNTPALGTAQQALVQIGQGGEASSMSLGCAVTYPLGVVGVILGFMVLRVWHIKRRNQNKAGDDEDNEEPFIVSFHVKNPAVVGKTLRQVAELTKRDDVLYAEPNYIYQAESTDVHTSEQWALDTTYGIHSEGWNTFDGDNPTPKVDTSACVVAIMDTGIDYNHEDLQKAIWSDGDKYSALMSLGGGKYGYNGVAYDSDHETYDPADPMDDHGHGTHCAGIVAADWNDVGVSGVASGAKVMAVKIGDNKGYFPLDAMLRGYRYVIEAKKAGVNIVVTNNSYGGYVESCSELLMIKEATDLGIVNCFAAANDSRNLNLSLSMGSSTAFFPASTRRNVWRSS